MSRSLAELKSECLSYNLTITQAGKRESKDDYERALREFLWTRDCPGQEMPEQIVPMLAQNSKDLDDSERDRLFSDNSGWVAQDKINGCRAMMKIRSPQQGGNQIQSRRLSDETYRLNDLTEKLPHYRDMDLGPDWTDTVIDGEILSSVVVVDTRIVDSKGVITLDILQATAAVLNCGADKSVLLQDKFGKLVHHAFDCLRFKGRDIRDLPYVALDKAGEIDRTKESRYLFLELAVARVQEVLGDLGCQHCEGITVATVENAPQPEAYPAVEQDDFMALLNG